jgi:transcriptional regulator with PAS, ATPase and Fis domain
VLLTGETGTGKDVAAHLIHEWSRRGNSPFVPINCSAIPNELMEAELFGYARGAFSGAIKDFDGQLGAAAGGTVFLDEIDDTPLSLQMKLLRVLEDRIVTRLGESQKRRVDFRIIAATNRDLKRLVRAGTFGADLFERLAIVRIAMPPLRERLEDLPALVAVLLRRFDDEEARDRDRVTSIAPSALAALAAYRWPGNIRELRNVIFESLVSKNSGDELLLSDLPRRVLRAAERGPGDGSDDDGIDDDHDGIDDEEDNDDRRGDSLARRIASGTFDLRQALNDLEGRALREAMRLGGTPVAAARLLGTVGRGHARDPADTVRAMLRRHHLDE